MITPLVPDHVREYCQLPAEGRFPRLMALVNETERPVHHLAVYHLCLAFFEIHRLAGTPIPVIRACWTDFADMHNQLGWENGGQHLILLDGFEENAEILHADLKQMPLFTKLRERGNHLPQLKRIELLSGKVIDRLMELEFAQRCWKTDEMPRVLADSPTPLPRNDISFVIDTNSLIALLSQLREDASWSQQIQHKPNLSVNVCNRCIQILNSYSFLPGSQSGAASGAKIIIPLVVLEETLRVASETQEDQALKVLDAIFTDEQPLWGAFELEPLTTDVLAFYLFLQERVHSFDVADAIIVAHALRNQCALASGQLYGRDPKWRRAKRLFPYLIL